MTGFQLATSTRRIHTTHILMSDANAASQIFHIVLDKVMNAHRLEAAG
jgi:hypothetical protein